MPASAVADGFVPELPSTICLKAIDTFRLVLGSMPAAVVRAGGDDGTKKLVGYFIEWGIYGRGYLIKNVVTSGSATKLTHINYAFSNAAPTQVTK